jgi:hypothetical protein
MLSFFSDRFFMSSLLRAGFEPQSSITASWVARITGVSKRVLREAFQCSFNLKVKMSAKSMRKIWSFTKSILDHFVLSGKMGEFFFFTLGNQTSGTLPMSHPSLPIL